MKPTDTPITMTETHATPAHNEYAAPEDFFKERQENDIDLVEAITQVLTETGHSAPRRWSEHPDIIAARTKTPKMQQFLINRYWRLALGSAHESTQAERFCLDDLSDPANYLKIFKGAVAPAIVRLDLPPAR